MTTLLQGPCRANAAESSFSPSLSSLSAFDAVEPVSFLRPNFVYIFLLFSAAFLRSGVQLLEPVMVKKLPRRLALECTFMTVKQYLEKARDAA